MANATGMGFIMPDGDDYIRDGDDAITVNAQLTADLIERHKNKRGIIPKNVDLREAFYGVANDGQWACLSGADCATLSGLPDDLISNPMGFSLTVKTINNGVILKINTYDVYGDAEYVCNSAPSNAAGWTRWKKYMFTEDLPESGGGGESSSGFKTLPLILTAGSGGGEALAPLSATVEYDVGLASSIFISRYRFAIRDGNPRWGTSTAQAIGLSNISFGGVVKLANMTTRADGEITFSRWLTGNFGNFKFDYTATQAPRYLVGGGRVNGARRTTMPFEIWLEVETPVGTPAIGLIGDSNSVAVNATIPIHDSWIQQYCRAKGFFPVIYGHSGDSMGANEGSNHYKWNRWNHLSRPDVVVHANGANDLPTTEGGITLAQLQTRARAEWEIAGQKISKNRHVALIKSRSSGVNNSVRLQLNAWYKTFPEPIREWHDIASPVTTGDTGGVLPQYISSDGVHMNTAGHTAIANALNKVMTTREALVFDQTAGRVVKAWDYLNNREQLIYGDTGVRDISGLLAIAGTVISFTLRRVGQTCFMALYNLQASAGGSGNLAVIPAGFRPTTTFGAPAQGLSSRWQVTNQGNVQAYNWTTSAVVGSLTWATSDPWPTSLPGVAT